MAPGLYNLEMYKGDTHRWQFKVWTDPLKTQPADLTGATGQCEIRNKSGGNVLATLTCTIVLPNIINLVFDTADWTTWPASGLKGVWDLQLTYPSGDVSTIVAGVVVVVPDITGSGP